jgi:two-component system, NarL family, nitrate/nitrite response regulator NarL
MSTLVIADPREVYLAGLEWVLREAGHSILADCQRAIDVPLQVQSHRPDIVIIGVNIADRETAGLCQQVKAANRATRSIIILQPSGRFDVKQIQLLDANGLLLDGVSRHYLVECVKAVAAGEKWSDPNILQHILMPRLQRGSQQLTARETEIAVLVSQGLRNKAIARQLNLSEGTVKMHLHNVYEKLDLRGRAELALSAIGNGARSPLGNGNGMA